MDKNKHFNDYVNFLTTRFYSNLSGMKLLVRTLNNQVYTFDVDPEDTVLSLKEKIFAQHNHPVSWQRLIYNGRFLEDSSTFNKNSLKNSDMLVVYVKKPDNISNEGNVKESNVIAPSSTPTSSRSSPAPEKADRTVKEPSTSTQITNNADSNTQAIEYICSMGFDREDAILALKHTQNDVQNAVQLLCLCNEVDTNKLTEDENLNDGQDLKGEDNADVLEDMDYGEHDQAIPHEDFGFDAESLFQNIMNNTDMLCSTQAWIDECRKQISIDDPDSSSKNDQIEIEDATFETQDEEASHENQPPLLDGYDAATNTIYLTQDENEAIQRLCDLGFDKSNAVEVFFACDKDEQMAANLLLENFKNY